LDALESASAGRIARPTFGTAVSLEFGSREAKGGVQFDLSDAASQAGKNARRNAGIAA
jgi:hypothetical protein